MGPNAGGGITIPLSQPIFVSAMILALAWLPWQRWKFGLRTLLIATTLVAIVLGLIVWLR